MTRKQRGESYNLMSARDRAAFEALVGDEDAEERPGAGAAGRGGASRKAEAAREKRGKERFFMLREDAARRAKGAGLSGSGGPGPAPGPGPGQRGADLAALAELLGGALPEALVADVYDGCGGRLEAALDALLAMAGGSGGGDAGASGSVGASGSAGASGSQAAASGYHADEAPGGRGWGDLPGDVVYAVLAHLAPRDLARLAASSRELRACAGRLQRVARSLRLTPGLSFPAASGIVASHPRAATVDVSRAGGRPGHWTAAALARGGREDAGPSARRLREAALGEQEAHLFQLLLAVAEGSGARRRRRGGGSGSGAETASGGWAPVSGLVARGLEAMSDQVLAETLGALRNLRWGGGFRKGSWW
jgi:hypothetical protein